MSANAIRMGKAYLELDAQTTPLKHSLQKASKDVKAFGAQVSSASTAMAGAFRAVSPALTSVGPGLTLVSLGLDYMSAGTKAIIGNMKELATVFLTSPLLLTITGIIVAITAVYQITKSLAAATKEQIKNEIAAAEHRTKVHKEAHSMREAQLGYLKKLNEKEILTNEERERAIRLVEELNKKYKGLGLSIDAATGKVRGVDEAIRKQKEATLEQELDDLARTNPALQDQADFSKNNADSRWGWNADKRRKDDLKERSDVLSKIRQNETRAAQIRIELLTLELEAEGEKNQKIVEARQRIAEAEQKLANIRQKNAQAQESQYQKEKRELDEEFRSRKALAKVIIDELEAKGKLSTSEKEKLVAAKKEYEIVDFYADGRHMFTEGNEYDTRLTDIEMRRAATVKKYSTADDDLITQSDDERRKKEEKRKFEALKTSDPAAAQAEAEEQHQNAQKAVEEARAVYDKMFEEFNADHDLTKDETDKLDAQLKSIADLERAAVEWQDTVDNVKIDAVKKQADEVQRTTGTTSMASVTGRDTVAAMSKIFELKSQQWNPVLESNRILNRILEEQFSMNGNLRGIG